jgi:hypothetical protein
MTDSVPLDQIDIYRVLVPVGTNENDIEMEQVEVLVGTYDDACTASRPHERTTYTTIEWFDGKANKWIEA